MAILSFLIELKSYKVVFYMSFSDKHKGWKPATLFLPNDFALLVGKILY